MKNKAEKQGKNGRIVNVGLTQMACSDDAEENLRRQVKLAERGGGAGGADHLHAGAFPVAIFLPDGGPPVL